MITSKRLHLKIMNLIPIEINNDKYTNINKNSNAIFNKKENIIKLNSLNQNEDYSINKSLVTDLTKELTNDEISVLSHGPKFALSSAINEKTKLDIESSFCRLAYQIRWRDAIDTFNKKYDIEQNSQTNSPFINWPNRTYVNQPPMDNQHLENKLNNIHAKFDKLVSELKPRPGAENLSQHNNHILKNLKEKPFIYLPSDKGGEFCVVNKDTYIEIGQNHLNDVSAYSKVNMIKPQTIENKINLVWRNICKELKLPVRIERQYITTNSRLPKFYHLIKTHKEGINLKIRPIVSCVKTPFHKLSWLCTQILNTLLKDVPAHLQDSSQLIDRIKSCPKDHLKKYNYPCSLDVEAMYPSIDPQSAITNLRNILNEKNFNYHGLKSDNFCQLLESLTKNFCFTYRDEMYKQNKGLPMGAPTSGLLAILYMDSLEKIHISSPSIGLYTRYIDDIFILTIDQEKANEIHETFNHIDNNIKFTIEHPKKDNFSYKLPLLDIEINLKEDGDLETNFYKKKAKAELFVNYSSALPINAKINYIINERNRIERNTTNSDQQLLNQLNFDQVLKLNGYPENIIKKSYEIKNKRDKKNNKKNKNDEKPHYLSIPFISNSFNASIRNVFKKENINVRLSHRSNTMRNNLSKKLESVKLCEKNNCTLRNNLCLIKNCVYKMTCQNCQSSYIGSTTRELHTRYEEHIKQKTSSIHKHLTKCKSIDINSNSKLFNIQILAKDHDPINLRIKESILIKRNKPEINAREEQAQFHTFVL